MTLYSPGGLNLADTTAPLILAFDNSGTTDVVFAVSSSGDLTITPDGGNITLAGHVDIVHTALNNDDHALELDVDAAGFGDVKAVDIVYTTGAIVAGEDEGIVLVSIDESAAAGGDIAAFEVLSTEGLAEVHGLVVGAVVHPVRQLSGAFADMDSALVNAVDRLTEFKTAGSDVQIFVADNDTVTIGDAAKFEELEFLLAVVASGGGIAPTFEFSTGVGTWTAFSPVDGTNGMKNTGIVAWEDSDIPTWATGTGSEYLIRITRTRNSLSTPPTESKVQIAALTEYSWDKDGDVSIRGLTAAGLITATAGVSIGVGTSVAGKIFRTSTQGVVVQGFTGSTNDFLIADPVGGGIISVPTGTLNCVFGGLITASAGISIPDPQVLTFGGDIVLARGSANLLSLASGDSLRLVSGQLQLASSNGIVFGASLDVTLSSSVANRLDLASGDSFNIVSGDLTVGGDAVIAGDLGLYGQAATAKPTGVAVTAAGVHAALVTLNLIAA